MVCGDSIRNLDTSASVLSPDAIGRDVRFQGVKLLVKIVDLFFKEFPHRYYCQEAPLLVNDRKIRMWPWCMILRAPSLVVSGGIV